MSQLALVFKTSNNLYSTGALAFVHLQKNNEIENNLIKRKRGGEISNSSAMQHLQKIGHVSLVD
jgi:hypothetical protein